MRITSVRWGMRKSAFSETSELKKPNRHVPSHPPPPEEQTDQGDEHEAEVASRPGSRLHGSGDVVAHTAEVGAVSDAVGAARVPGRAFGAARVHHGVGVVAVVSAAAVAHVAVVAARARGVPVVAHEVPEAVALMDVELAKPVVLHAACVGQRRGAGERIRAAVVAGTATACADGSRAAIRTATVTIDPRRKDDLDPGICSGPRKAPIACRSLHFLFSNT